MTRTLEALDPRVIAALDPGPLPALEERRFGLHGIHLVDFAAGDRATITALYGFLSELYAVARAVVGGEEPAAAVGELLRVRTFTEALAPRFAGLGVDGEAGERTLALREAYHDLRGGSYNALALLHELFEEGEELPGEVERVYLLARDHLKIMRSAVNDLDPEQTAADQEILLHRIELLADKWSGIDYSIAGASAAIDYVSKFTGSVADCCIEFAALDRVLYNLINNATRFAADGVVRVRIAPVAPATTDPAAPVHVRFAVINRITAAQRETLVARFGGDDLRGLFGGGFTTGGHGIGLRICADLVVHGYRLSSLEQALGCGLVGARIIEDHFVAWFHWPGRLASAAV